MFIRFSRLTCVRSLWVEELAAFFFCGVSCAWEDCVCEDCVCEGCSAGGACAHARSQRISETTRIAFRTNAVRRGHGTAIPPFADTRSPSRKACTWHTEFSEIRRT